MRQTHSAQNCFLYMSKFQSHSDASDGKKTVRFGYATKQTVKGLCYSYLETGTRISICKYVVALESSDLQLPWLFLEIISQASRSAQVVRTNLLNNEKSKSFCADSGLSHRRISSGIFNGTFLSIFLPPC